MYIIRDREAGNAIATFPSREQAESNLEWFEFTDKADGTFTPDFYEIVEENE